LATPQWRRRVYPYRWSTLLREWPPGAMRALVIRRGCLY